MDHELLMRNTRKITELENRQRVNISNVSNEAKLLKNEGTTVKAVRGAVVCNATIKAPNIPEDLEEQLANGIRRNEFEDFKEEINEALDEKAQLIHTHTLSEITDYEPVDISRKADKVITTTVKVSNGGTPALIFGPLPLNPDVFNTATPITFRGWIKGYRNNSGTINGNKTYFELDYIDQKLKLLNEYHEGGNLGKDLSWTHKWVYYIRSYQENLYLVIQTYGVMSWLGTYWHIDGTGNCSGDYFKVVPQSQLTEVENDIVIERTTADQDRITQCETKVDSWTQYDDTELRELINGKADNGHTHVDLETAIASKADNGHTHVDLETAIASKADNGHTHTMSEITDYEPPEVITRSMLLDLVYPIGSVYVSTDSTSPATRFGGEWEQIIDRFLYCTNSALETGGSKKISVGQLPPHDHGCFGPDDTFGDPDGAADTASYKYNYWRGNRNLEFNVWTESRGNGEDYMPPYMTVYAWYRKA